MLTFHPWRRQHNPGRNNPRALETVMSLIVLHLHLRPFAAYGADQLDLETSALDAEGRQGEKLAAAGCGYQRVRRSGR
jgi:hypothetical protein